MTPALSQIIVASGEEGGHPIVNELIFDPIWFGVLTLAIFLALLGLLLFFRNSLALEPHGTEASPTSDVHGTRAS